MSTQRRELACVAALVVICMCFTWRGLTMFFSGDDLMNMYKAWTTPALRIWKAQIMPWAPLFRPLGAGVYRVFYSIFGYHPLPLYIFCWLLLIGNIFAAWRFFRAVSSTVFDALIALSLTLVHGLFQDLYLSAGTIYDRLCFLFTVLAVIVYARTRREGSEISVGRTALLGAICLFAINSKESGAAVPAILFCYECVYGLPSVWREHRVREWIRSIAPLYCVLAAILAAFAIGRMRGTQDLSGNPAYQPHASLNLWLTHVAEYLNILLYRDVHFTAVTTAIALIAMLALAAVLRNRAMLFGWLYFTIAITPVALISSRPGYVLYVPDLGLGLYFAALIGLAVAWLLPRSDESLSFAQVAVFALVTVLITWVHADHWPEPWRVSDSPQWRLAEAMRRDYPTMKPGAKILFANDYPSGNSYDLLFNLCLLYHDPLIEVARLKGPVIQQPEPGRPWDFDHVFTTEQDTYVELDRRDVKRSIELNILQDYLPGRVFDADRADRAGYVVSGILTSGPRGAGWWTTRSTKLKFDVYPADSTLTLKFWPPDSVARVSGGNLSAIVDGETVGTLALTHPDVDNVTLPVPARAINASGFTILELNVDRPGTQGVALLQASFDYVRR